MRRLRTLLILAFAATIVAASKPQPHRDAGVVVIGAGIAGLSAAYEAAHHDATVIVVDAGSVFGGHAVMAGGHVAIVDTPLQRSRGIHDSPELAAKDFITWGEDADKGWVDYYSRHSRSDIYDWLTSLGARFTDLFQYSGNSVPRAHIPVGAGLGLVAPIYRACLADKRIEFRWHTRVVSLADGVETVDTRTGERATLRSGAVIIATGGFQSNVDFVRAHWPSWMAKPPRLLAGSGIESQGSGLGLATGKGAALRELDHQWNYETGLPDPRFPGRGLNAYDRLGIWVNLDGKRFVDEHVPRPERLRAMLAQPGSTYWMIIDAEGREHFAISGTDWQDQHHVDDVILNNPAVTKRANTIAELATLTHLPPATLAATVRAAGTITKPPFYAIQFFPLARKSIGGIAVDHECHVVDANGHPIAGLFAAGEATGFGGINGKAGLEGTFLGPSLVMGRVAGREAAKETGRGAPRVLERGRRAEARRSTVPFDSTPCMTCHDMKALTSTSRPGYWHFEMAHRVVLQKQIDCRTCHQTHTIDPLAQSRTCERCHGAGD